MQTLIGSQVGDSSTLAMMSSAEEYESDFEDDSGAEGGGEAPAVIPVEIAAGVSGAGAVLSSPTHGRGRAWVDVPFAEVELGERIGGGGFAVVYRGHWKGEEVALKTLVSAVVKRGR